MTVGPLFRRATRHIDHRRDELWWRRRPQVDTGGRCCLPPLGRRRPPQILLSRLNHAAHILAVYASQPGSPHVHARLASGWRPPLPGGVSPPAGLRSKVSVMFLVSGSSRPPSPSFPGATATLLMQRGWRGGGSFGERGARSEVQSEDGAPSLRREERGPRRELDVVVEGPLGRVGDLVSPAPQGRAVAARDLVDHVPGPQRSPDDGEPRHERIRDPEVVDDDLVEAREQDFGEIKTGLTTGLTSDMAS